MMSQQFTKLRLNPSQKLHEYSEEDDENSNASEHYQNFYSVKSQATLILQENLNLQYDFQILENQLNQLRKKQLQKDSEIKKWKEKMKNKQQKQGELKRHIEHIQKGKSKKLNTGFKNLNEESQEMKKKQKKIRSLRMNAQEQKNHLYEKYVVMQAKYKEVISYLQQLNGVQESLDDVERENKFLAQRIQNIEREINSTQDHKNGGQKTTRERVKELNNRVKQLQTEQVSLQKQIYSIQCSHQDHKNEERNIQQKNQQIQVLRKKIEETKTNVNLKRSEHNNLDSAFQQLCIEESKLRKQQVLEKECLSEQKKYKEATNRKSNRKFHILDSEGQDSKQFRKSSSPQKHREQSDRQMNKIFEQYDRVSNRINNRK